MKISLWGTICLFLTFNIVQAQSKVISNDLPKKLKQGYGSRVHDLDVEWKTPKGDYYLGSGTVPHKVDSVYGNSYTPMICLVDGNEDLVWVHYLKMPGWSINYLSLDTIDGHLVTMGKQNLELLQFMEFDEEGNWVNHLSLPLDSVEALKIPYSVSSVKRYWQPTQLELHKNWRVLHHETTATLLNRDGTLVWNDSLPETNHDPFTFAEAPNGNLIGLRTDANDTDIDWISFEKDGEVRQGAYGNTREKWNKKNRFRKHRLTGLYDTNPHREEIRIFPVENGIEGYLITAQTYDKYAKPKKRKPGHLLQLIDTLGNPVWTRHYNWPADIMAVSGRVENLRVEFDGGNSEELDSLGFYIRYGESLRKTNKIKDKTIAKYDELEWELVNPEYQKNDVIPGQYAKSTEVIEVDSLIKRPPPPPPKVVAKTSTSSYSGSSGSGKRALRGLANMFRGIGKALRGARRRRSHRRFRLFR